MTIGGKLFGHTVLARNRRYKVYSEGRRGEREGEVQPTLYVQRMIVRLLYSFCFLQFNAHC